jgi:predicted phage terminase large subunit-like protein
VRPKDADIRRALAKLTPAERAELDEILATIPAPIISFREFVTKVRPGYKWYWHCGVLADVLQQVADDERDRVMVFMPPRHGKSELVSRLFPAYYLQRYRDRLVGLASYAATLAFTLSRNAREYYRGSAGLSEYAKAVNLWETGRGGGMWATGVGGPATGMGFHLGIIDDPVKNAEEAQSETIQLRNEDWYESVFGTRPEPGAAIVVIQTRWHEKDLSGYLLTREHTEKPECWHIVDFPAILEDDPLELPPSCTLEPDPRDMGAPLCPERYPLEKLEQFRARSEYWFGALYQQRPRPREGGMFKRAWFLPAEDHAPARFDQVVRFWDKAATEGGGDYTVGAKLGRANGKVWLLDVVRDRLDSGKRDQLILATAERDGENVIQVAEQEPGASGKDAAIAFKRMLRGFVAHTDRSDKKKELRADGMASGASIGDVRMLKADWNEVFLDELTAFPMGAHDDQVDAAAGAYNRLTRQDAISVSPGAVGRGPSYWKGPR